MNLWTRSFGDIGVITVNRYNQWLLQSQHCQIYGAKQERALNNSTLLFDPRFGLICISETQVVGKACTAPTVGEPPSGAHRDSANRLICCISLGTVSHVNTRLALFLLFLADSAVVLPPVAFLLLDLFPLSSPRPTLILLSWVPSLCTLPSLIIPLRPLIRISCPSFSGSSGPSTFTWDWDQCGYKIPQITDFGNYCPNMFSDLELKRNIEGQDWGPNWRR